MPELPEVETVRRTLKNFVLNKKIISIDVLYPNIIEDDVEEFIEACTNQTINDIDRAGKFLIFKLDDIAFVSHLRMEGKYHYVEHDEPLNKHDHIIFNLDDNKQLRYNDTRKFANWVQSLLMPSWKIFIQNYIKVIYQLNMLFWIKVLLRGLGIFTQMKYVLQWV